MSSYTWTRARAPLRGLRVAAKRQAPMSPHIPLFRSRREFLRLAGGGFGALALAALAAEETRGLTAPGSPGMDPFAPKKPHFPVKAKSVIFLFMEGGPSHVDLVDPKPELTRQNGKPLPAS